MSHAEYISEVRAQAARLAEEALAGRVNFLEACHSLCSLLGRADLEENDPDLRAFVIVSSEADALPVGSVRERWDSAALENLQPEIDSAVEWALPIVTPALESVIYRFKA